MREWLGAGAKLVEQVIRGWDQSEVLGIVLECAS
jgi:hypothetical protein